MLILIDKYGCPGFKFTQGSTPYLTLGIITFCDLSEAEKAGKAVAALAKKRNITSGFQFRKTRVEIKSLFLDACCHYDFEIKVLIADKAGISDPALRHNPRLFYDYIISSLFENSRDVLADASLKISGNTDRVFRHSLETHLHEKSEHYGFKKFRFGHPEKDALLQLTDMLIGAISKSYTDESIVSNQLLDKLVAAKKIKSVWRLR